jgi:hypothetical protein
MLKAEDALRIEDSYYGKADQDGNRRSYKLYVYECACGAKIGSQSQHLKKHSGKCVSCSQFNDPFRAAYNELVKCCARRLMAIDIAYEDFLIFTKTTKCHYCYSPIFWYPHTKLNGKEVAGSRSYKLDRMNNDIGYLKSNCVVCCKRCNEGKSGDFTYEEWHGMTAYFRSKT